MTAPRCYKKKQVTATTVYSSPTGFLPAEISHTATNLSDPDFGALLATPGCGSIWTSCARSSGCAGWRLVARSACGSARGREPSRNAPGAPPGSKDPRPAASSEATSAIAGPAIVTRNPATGSRGQLHAARPPAREWQITAFSGCTSPG
jgi:hypothetical protein